MKKLSLSIFIALIGLSGTANAMKLSSFKHTAAWVMPITSYYKKTDGKYVEYVVLGREAGGKDKGTYDAFGGDTEKNETHPVVTAAREFAEEAVTEDTLSMNTKAIQKHIDLKAGNTDYILAIDDTKYKARNVLYITRFSGDQISKLKKRFAKARKSAKSWKYKEKDSIAIVRLEYIWAAIKDSKSNTDIYVMAAVTDLKGNTQHKQIILRPVFARIVRGHIEGKKYKSGKNKKIHYYTLK